MLIYINSYQVRDQCITHYKAKRHKKKKMAIGKQSDCNRSISWNLKKLLLSKLRFQLQKENSRLGQS